MARQAGVRKTGIDMRAIRLRLFHLFAAALCTAVAGCAPRHGAEEEDDGPRIVSFLPSGTETLFALAGVSGYPSLDPDRIAALAPDLLIDVHPDGDPPEKDAWSHLTETSVSSPPSTGRWWS